MISKVIKDAILDSFYPPFCVLCGAISHGRFPHCCDDCYSSFQRLHGGVCSICGKPFPVDDLPHPCLECIGKNPPYSWCRAMYLYSGRLAEAISLLKYRRKMSLLDVVMSAAVEAIGDIHVPEADLVVPVPTIFTRLMRRGFNQASVLARPLAEGLGIGMLPEALKRAKGRPQVGLDMADRAANVRGAFVPGRDYRELDGKRVLVFDDVYTSGATVKECSRVIGRIASGVSVLTLARAGGPESPGNFAVNQTVGSEDS